MRAAEAVARRAVILELLLQRFGLETDTEDSAADRDRARSAWVSRLGDLGVDADITTSERAFLERPVGELSEDELDDIHGRAAGVLVLLWALGRLPTRPSFEAIDEMETLAVEHGVLGSGSISQAKAAIAGAALRAEAEIESGQSAYERIRGKAREATSPDAIVAELGVHHLDWVLDPEMPFESDERDSG